MQTEGHHAGDMLGNTWPLDWLTGLDVLPNDQLLKILLGNAAGQLLDVSICKVVKVFSQVEPG